MSRTDVQDLDESVTSMNPVMAPALGLILYLGAVVLGLAADAGRALPAGPDRLGGQPGHRGCRGGHRHLGLPPGHHPWNWLDGANLADPRRGRGPHDGGLLGRAPLRVRRHRPRTGLGGAPDGRATEHPGIVGMLLGALALVSGAITMVVG